jgi:hypothetical protein
VTTVSPPSFTKVDYDASALAALVDRARAMVPGLPPELGVEVRIDEERATTTARVVARDPWILEVDGGAVEDTQRPRTVGPAQALVTFCRLLFEVADRLDEHFGAPALGAPEDPALRVAWDTYCVGRAARCGLRVHQPKYRYNFRNRVGFSDAADACFDRVWSAERLSWVDIEALVTAARPADAPGGAS